MKYLQDNHRHTLTPPGIMGGGQLKDPLKPLERVSTKGRGGKEGFKGEGAPISLSDDRRERKHNP